MGRESEPALSPDGNWVAYLWTGSDSGNVPGLYVKGFHADTSRQLPTGDSPHRIRALAFSPDSSRIAFRRQDGIFEAARDGSREPSQLAASADHCQGTGLDWSPGGRSLLLAECPAGSKIPAVVELDLASGRRRQITFPPANTQGDFDPRYSPDGQTIAFRRAVQPVVEDLYILALGSNASPTAISRDGRGIAGLAWMPDGKSLLVSSQRTSGIYALWRFSLDRPFEPVAFTQAGQHAKSPTVSRKGPARAAWIDQVTDHNIWELQEWERQGRSAPKRIVASLQRDVDGHIGPDGRLAFRSDRSGVSEIWVSAPDGSSPVRVTAMDGPLTGTPRWSPNGKHLVFDSRPASNPDIYLIRCEGACDGSRPRRLTDHPASDVMPSWSRDGKFVYFGSSRTGRRELWRISIEEGAKAQQITRNGGYLGIESEDGQWLYFSKIVEQHGIWRIPLGRPGAEEFVAELFDDYGAGSWLLAPGGKEILYLGSGKNKGLRAWNLLTRQDRLLHNDPIHSIERGLSISADGRRIVYSQLDRSDSNVMVAEGLR
jgi:Tol biopolymer transport system component